jgi:hypothetical protein
MFESCRAHSRAEASLAMPTERPRRLCRRGRVTRVEKSKAIEPRSRRVQVQPLRGHDDLPRFNWQAPRSLSAARPSRSARRTSQRPVLSSRRERSAKSGAETGRVAAPDEIVLSRDRDLQGRRKDVWVRRSLLGLAALVPILALFNLFGQRPTTSKASVSAATLSVYAPTRLRGGLLWEGRFHITAHQEIKNAILVLSASWAEGMSINTIEPSPSNEASDNGKLEFTLGHIPANQSFILYMQFQVNPTNVGHRSRSTSLYDGETKLASVHQKVTIFP